MAVLKLQVCPYYSLFPDPGLYDDQFYSRDNRELIERDGIWQAF